jgi:hypothetical protein
LRREVWFIIEVAAQRVRPIFKWQDVKEKCFFLGRHDPQKGADTLFRNVGIK